MAGRLVVEGCKRVALVTALARAEGRSETLACDDLDDETSIVPARPARVVPNMGQAAEQPVSGFSDHSQIRVRLVPVAQSARPVLLQAAENGGAPRQHHEGGAVDCPVREDHWCVCPRDLQVGGQAIGRDA